MGPGSRTNITPVGRGVAPAQVGPASRPGMNPVGPGSRAGMAPVGPPSRPNATPVGRLSATALAVPAKAPSGPVAPSRPVDVDAEALTTITPVVPAPPAESAEPSSTDGPERREDIDPSCLTSEMEPISEAVEQKRTIDATLARFSAVHDEMAAEEAQRRSRRVRIMPWLGKDDDLEEALTKNGPVSPATAGETRRSVAVKPERKVPLPKLPAKLAARGGKSITSAKMAAVAIAVLVLVGSFFGWRAINGGGGSGPGGGQIEVAALDENSPAILDSQKQYSDSNFLMVGTTSRPGGKAGADQSTDTIMVVHIPTDGSRVDVVSFPPNLQVDRPVCQRWDNTTNQTSGQVPAQTGVKLSSVYATGGPRCVTDTVQQLSGLRINHFVGVDTNGFSSLVNSVQGVQLCVRAAVKDAKLGTVIGQSGQVSLSGTKALDYVTADQVAGDKNADLARIGRQQRFLSALLRKTIGQQNILLNTNLLNNFLDTFSRSTFGDNMGVDQLAKLATSLQGLALGHITFVTLPTAAKLTSAGDETTDATTSKQLFNAVIDNSPMPGETGGTQGTTDAKAGSVSPKDIKVQVINSTDVPNEATNTAEALKPFGYTITQIGGTAPPDVTKTVIKYASAQQTEAQLLATSVPDATLQLDPSMDGAIQLVIGPGFNHTVKAPNAGAAASGKGAPASEAPAGLSYVNAADSSCA
jgi:LCP family protein required for cell wall assembly